MKDNNIKTLEIGKQTETSASYFIEYLNKLCVLKLIELHDKSRMNDILDDFLKIKHMNIAQLMTYHYIDDNHLILIKN